MKQTAQDYDLEVNFYCCMYPACGSEYSSKYNLKRHVESVHLKVKKFSCSICKNLFSSKQSLKEHYYKHQGAMPFRCITCDKSFRQASLLSLHKRVHNSQGTTLETSKSEFDVSDMKFDKVEMDVKQVNICLPAIEESRKGFKILPFPKFVF
jgi:uncharacterized Zn-finger protein